MHDYFRPSLGDLRKAVTEETSKATDATRQAIASISTALTVGLSLIAAPLTLQIKPYIISLVMAVAFGYTTLNVMSGSKFINIQRQLRQDWQSKLYRFLSEFEYKKTVGDPIEQAESFFYRISCQGLTMLGAAALGISSLRLRLHHSICGNTGSPCSASCFSNSLWKSAAPNQRADIPAQTGARTTNPGAALRKMRGPLFELYPP